MADYQYRQAASVGPSWVSTFSATLAAVVLGGLFLGACFRTYFHWSIKDTLQQIKSTAR